MQSRNDERDPGLGPQSIQRPDVSGVRRVQSELPEFGSVRSGGPDELGSEDSAALAAIEAEREARAYEALVSSATLNAAGRRPGTRSSVEKFAAFDSANPRIQPCEFYTLRSSEIDRYGYF